MDEENKLPLKRVELSLTKFNEVAIPHHLDLLRQHKANIVKYEQSGELARARAEQRLARRVAARLRGALEELAALRRAVRGGERARFDRLTQRARDATLRAVSGYLDVIESSRRALVTRRGSARAETSPLSIDRPGGADGQGGQGGLAASAVSTDSVGLVAHARGADAVPLDDDQIQLHVDEQELALGEREELLRGWSELQAELRALHDVWHASQAAALAQRELVARGAASVGQAADDVGAARTHLAAAERLRAGACAGGACVGALLAGPLGLAAGAKAGALAAAAGSLLGYAAVRWLRPPPAVAAPPAPGAGAEGKHKEQ